MTDPIFIFQHRKEPGNITHDIFFIYTTDIFRTWMRFLRVNVMFYDVVNVIHNVTTIANPFLYTAKFMFVGVRNNKTQQIRR